MGGKHVAGAFAVALAVAAVGTAGASLMHRISASPTGTQVTVHGQWTNSRPQQAPQGRRPRALRFCTHDASGAAVLARLLSRASGAGSWGVNIGFGAIVDSTNTAPDSPPFYKNLTVTAPTSGPDANKVVLAGTATPSADTTINNVDTYLRRVHRAPDGRLHQPASSQFTHKALDGINGDPAAVPVAAGQQVAVTVKLSFS